MKLTAEKIIKLLQVKGIGRGKVITLSGLLPDIRLDDDVLADIVLENISKLKLTALTKEEILSSFSKGQELIDLSLEKSIKLIGFWDNEYPQSLKDTTTPPIFLNVLGNLDAILNMPSVAVIGTRQPSEYGRQIGERIGYKLGENKINVVSGLALGCDTAGHVGCLKAKGVTTAVLAHGLDSIYPKENSGLAQSILDNNGCLVSEYIIKTRGLPNYFVERDRLQAGLSKGTIVVETDIKGGTMHTVKFTLEYKRILAAFCHPLEKRNEKSRGNEYLFDRGEAIKLESQEDINVLIKQVKPSAHYFPENFNSIEAIQMPAFDLEAFTIKDYQYAAVKKKRKTKKKTKEGDLQKKLYSE